MSSFKALVQRVLGITGSAHKIEFAVDDTGEKEVWGFKKDDSTEVTPFTDDIKIKSGLAQDVDGMFIPANSSSEYHSIGFGMERTGSGSSVKETWGYKKDASGNLVPFCDMDAISKAIMDSQDAMIETMYPVGSLYITTGSVPSYLKNKINGGASRGWTWSIVADGKALWGCSSGATGTIDAGLPNITGTLKNIRRDLFQPSTTEKLGAFEQGMTSSSIGCNPGNNYSSSDMRGTYTKFDASWSNSIYGKSTTVQPPAYKVYIYRRTK